MPFVRVVVPLPLARDVRPGDGASRPGPVSALGELHSGAVLLVHIHVSVVLLVVSLLVPLLRVLLHPPKTHVLLLLRRRARLSGLRPLLPGTRGAAVLHHHRVPHLLPLHG